MLFTWTFVTSSLVLIVFILKFYSQCKHSECLGHFSRVDACCRGSAATPPRTKTSSSKHRAGRTSYLQLCITISTTSFVVQEQPAVNNFTKQLKAAGVTRSVSGKAGIRRSDSDFCVHVLAVTEHEEHCRSDMQFSLHPSRVVY